MVEWEECPALAHGSLPWHWPKSEYKRAKRNNQQPPSPLRMFQRPAHSSSRGPSIHSNPIRQQFCCLACLLHGHIMCQPPAIHSLSLIWGRWKVTGDYQGSASALWFQGRTHSCWISWHVARWHQGQWVKTALWLVVYMEKAGLQPGYF